MSGWRARNQPTRDGIPPSEGTEAKVVTPPNPCPKACKGLVNIPTNPIPLIQEDFGRDKDLKNLLKSL